MTACSSDVVLARMLDQELDDANNALIVDHVESCAACQERLRQLTSDCSSFFEWAQIERSSIVAGVPATAVAYTPPRWHSILRVLDDSTPETSLRFSGLQGPITRSADVALGPGDGLPEMMFPPVDGYQILTKLGHGGMGVVYKAHQHRLGRDVALKMIRAGSLAKPEDLARFKIEAEVVAKQRHANIIQIFDIGEVEGLPFVALELLEGGSLDARLGRTPQPGAASAKLSATLARAIHAAHEAGIIHRDLKPSNILFALDGTPKITDFGLAKRLEEEGYTETGQVLGSPSYIPPEQARGWAREVGPTADVYALGAILYEMLTGRPPFKGTTPVETVMQVLNEEPVPPSQLVSQVPRDLETICLKCLAKEPHQRYASALALANDLDRYLADRPIHARRTPLLIRAAKWMRRRPTASGLLAAVCIVVLFSLFFGLRSQAELRAELDRDEASLTEFRNELLDGHNPIAELSRLVARTESDRRLAGVHSRALEMFTEARRRADEKQAVAVERELLREFLNRRDEGLFQHTQLTGLDSAENGAGVRKGTLAALKLFGMDLRRVGEWAMPRLPDSWSQQERDTVIRGCYEMLMVLAEAVAQPLRGESATLQAREALQILDRAASLLPQPTHAFHLRKAACLQGAGDTEGAKHEKLSAERIQPDSAFDHFLTGLELYKRGQMSQARRHFTHASQAQANHFWAQCLLAICDLNTKDANAEGARAYLTACLQSHPELSWLYLLRGFASGQIGSRAASADDAAASFASAEADYREAQRRDPDNRYRYALLVNRGLLRFQSQRQDEAVADLEEAIALDPTQLSAYITLAQIHRHRHHLDRALAELGRAIALNSTLAPLYRTRARWALEGTHTTASDRALALADLDRALLLGVPSSREQARDYAEKGRVLLLNKQWEQALDACDASLRLELKDTKVYHYRVSALLELNRDSDAIAACDAGLKAGLKSAELLGLRGLAKTKRNEIAAAIDDYTLALALEPAEPAIHSRRGWAYVILGAPQLALRDFDEAIRLDSSGGDSHLGRGSALVALGRCREAVRDAQESLRHGEQGPRALYGAARIMALAAEYGKRDRRPRDLSESANVQTYEDRALALLGQAVERTPPGDRAAFWRDVVQADRGFNSIRRLPAWSRIAAVTARQTP